MDFARARSLPLALALLALAASSAHPAAQSLVLNGPLAQTTSGDVSSFLVSPDGAHVVYRADQEVDNRFELFSVPADRSSAPVRLNAANPAGNVGGVVQLELDLEYAISVSGRVVYLAEQTASGVTQLFSVPVDRSAPPIRLNGTLPAGGDVADFWLRGDDVEYRADQLADGEYRLYRVLLDGSAAAVDLAPGQNVGNTWVRDDGVFAAFTAAVDATHRGLFVVPTDGSAAPLLLAQIVPQAGFSVRYFGQLTFAPDGQHAVYTVVRDLDGDLASDLYAVPLDGSVATQRLNLQTFGGTLQYGVGASRVAYIEGSGFHSSAFDGTGRTLLDPPGWRSPSFFDITPDGLDVVFSAFSTSLQGTRVFRAPLDGSAPATAITPLGSYSTARVQFAGSFVLYGALYSSTQARALYKVPLDGSAAPLQLDGPLVDGRGAMGFQLRPGGATVLFVSDRDTDDVLELFEAPLDASEPPRKLSAPFAPAGDVRNFRITPDGARVVYHADASIDELWDLFGVPVTAGVPHVKYDPTLRVGPVVGDVAGFLATADGKRAVYRADQDENDVVDLYATSADGRGTPERLTAPLASSQITADLALAPTSDRVVFERQTASAFELRSALLDASAPPVSLDVATSGFLTPFLVDPTGTRVVYRVIASPNVFVLRGALLDGSAPPVTLDDPPGNQAVREVQLDALGAFAVYRVDAPVVSSTELWSVASDGTTAPVRLCPALVAGGTVAAFQVTSDATRVVFHGDVETNGVAELYAAPIGGGTPAVKLSGALAAGGNVTDLALTPDAQRAAYLADATTDGDVELWSVPVDASAAPVRLNATLVAGGDVTAPIVPTASGRVLYLADQDTDGVFELYSAPSDGSAAPLRLSGALVTGGDVAEFVVSPDGTRVLYLADQRVDGVVEPFAAPTDGSGPALALQLLPPFADASVPRIDAGSQYGYWLADADVDGTLDLHFAPLDGSSAAQRVNGTLPVGGDVQTDFATLGGGRALWRADEHANDVLELFTRIAVDAGHPLHGGASPSGAASVQR